MPNETAPKLDWALWYAQVCGIPVFPCHSKSKEPHGLLVPHGVKEATTDPDKIRRWWSEFPDANIGAACGGAFDVVDIDWDAAEILIDKEFPIGALVETPSGFQHAYFASPEIAKKNAVRFLKGLDYRGKGGYVLLPPSYVVQHPEPNRPEDDPKHKGYEGWYRWALPLTAETVLPPLPQWLLDAVPEKGTLGDRYEGKVWTGPISTAWDPNDEATRGAEISSGGRNNGLYRIGCSYRAKRRLDANAILRKLLAVNQTRCKPPLDDEEVMGIAASCARWQLGKAQRGETDVPEADTFKEFGRHDLGNAERFVHEHGDRLRWCAAFGFWLIWDGARWASDQSRGATVLGFAADTARGMYAEAAAEEDSEKRAALGKWANQAHSKARLENMVSLAKSIPGISVSPDDLDADTDLVNCLNGTIHLPTGVLRPHDRSDLITKVCAAPYDPEAPRAAFGAFLSKMIPDDDLRGFVKRFLGYSLGGPKSEQCFAFAYGARGRNGKSTLTEAVAHVLGDYAQQTPPDTLTLKPGQSIPNDVARLKGARFVTVPEWPANAKLDEGLVKRLTGQDRVTARFMRGEFFEFRPQFALWGVGNHKPEIRGTDDAIWRRVRLVPFEVTLSEEEADKDLPQKLAKEAAGILRWLVEGHQEWRERGLGLPGYVADATAEYRKDSDRLSDFLGSRLVAAPGYSIRAKVLYETYRSWAKENGEYELSNTLFGRGMTERGYVRKHSRDGEVYRDIALIQSEAQEAVYRGD